MLDIGGRLTRCSYQHYFEEVVTRNNNEDQQLWLAEEDEANSGRGGRGGRGTTRTRAVRIAQYIGSLYGGDIMGELDTKKEFSTPSPEYPQSAELRRQDYETMIRAQQASSIDSLRRKEQRLRNQLATTSFTEIDVIDRLEEQ